MRKIALLFVLPIFFISCEKKDVDYTIPSIRPGIYTGKKTIQNFSTGNYLSDTITIKFTGSKYFYSGTWTLDYGQGNYNVITDSIEFNDELFRDAMHSWNWIMTGKYKTDVTTDSLILYQKHYNQLITCKLARMPDI